MEEEEEEGGLPSFFYPSSFLLLRRWLRLCSSSDAAAANAFFEFWFNHTGVLLSDQFSYFTFRRFDAARHSLVRLLFVL